MRSQAKIFKPGMRIKRNGVRFEVFEKLLESCEASSYYALLIAERLSTLGHELNTGETLLDKVLSQKTVREDPNTSYTEHTELEQAERLWGEHLL